MINVVQFYEDCRDAINTDENGNLSYRRFNRFLWVAQLMAIDILTGKLSGGSIPSNYFTQKSKDLLANFVVIKNENITNGQMAKPDDYYTYDTFELFGSKNDNIDCENEEITGANTPIQILDSAQFSLRGNTYIDEMKPTISTPIAKLEGKTFSFLPKALGGVKLVYIKFPVKAEIKIIINPQTNNEEPDLVNSVNLEWDESTRNLLLYCLVDSFSMWNREQQLFQQNQIKGKNMVE